MEDLTSIGTPSTRAENAIADLENMDREVWNAYDSLLSPVLSLFSGVPKKSKPKKALDDKVPRKSENCVLGVKDVNAPTSVDKKKQLKYQLKVVEIKLKDSEENEALKDLREANAELLKEKDNLEKENKDLSERCSETNALLAKLDEANEAKTLLENELNQAKQLERQNFCPEEDVLKLQTKFDVISKEKDKLLDELSKLKENFEKAKSEIDQLQADKKEVKLEEALLQIESLNQKIMESEALSKTKEDAVAEAEKEIEDKKYVYVFDLKTIISDLSSQVTSLNRKIEEFENMKSLNSELTERVNKLETDAQDADHIKEVENLKKQLACMKEELSATKLAMEEVGRQAESEATKHAEVSKKLETVLQDMEKRKEESSKNESDEKAKKDSEVQTEACSKEDDNQLEEMKQKLGRQNGEIETLKKQLDDVKASLSAKEQLADMTRIEFETTKTIVKKLQEEKKQLAEKVAKLETASSQDDKDVSDSPKFKVPKSRRRFTAPAITTTNPRSAASSVSPAQTPRASGTCPKKKSAFAFASPMTPKSNCKKSKRANATSELKSKIPAPRFTPNAVTAQTSQPLLPPLKLDKATARALKAEFLKQADIMKHVEKDSDWNQRMKAMDVLKTLIVDKRVTETKMWNTNLKKIYKTVMTIQLQDLRSSIIKAACNLLVTTAKEMGERFTELLKFFIPKLMKLLYVTIKIISVTGYETMSKMIATVGSLQVIPTLVEQATHDSHAQVRHRALEFIGSMIDSHMANGSTSSSLLSYREDTKATMLKCLADADTSVRAQARKLFATFRVVWPDIGAALFEEMAPETQRAINRDSRSTSVSRKRKKGFKQKSDKCNSTWSSGMLRKSISSLNRGNK
eukprot:jgi/Bigna1/131897/aug1.15_g6605